MNKAKAKPTIIAYGFDAAGFAIPETQLETAKFIIRFLEYNAEESLENANGIITPSGIFEKFETTDNYYDSHTYVKCDKDQLAKRTKEVIQNCQNSGWIAFLVQKVNMDRSDWRDTDLCKRFLNSFFYQIEYHDPNPYVQCKADEFADYLHDFGINRTTFRNARNDHKPRALAATSGGAFVAAELVGKIFFLPLPSIKRDETELTKLVTKCADAILEYKRRNDLHLPAWVENIEFQTETKLRAEVVELEKQIIQKQEELSKWRKYKGIVSASGKSLNGLVVEILRDYFKLDLHSKEEFIEDAIIRDGDKPLFVVEIKGVNGGLKREHVNQVDSHRERLGISADVPGLLIINDFTDIDGFAERKAKRFDKLHVDHAEKLNIKILRTTTLIEIIRLVEMEKERGRKVLHLCSTAKPMVELARSA
jgi:hypothetical protein